MTYRGVDLPEGPTPLLSLLPSLITSMSSSSSILTVLSTLSTPSSSSSSESESSEDTDPSDAESSRSSSLIWFSSSSSAFASSLNAPACLEERRVEQRLACASIVSAGKCRKHNGHSASPSLGTFDCEGAPTSLARCSLILALALAFFASNFSCFFFSLASLLAFFAAAAACLAFRAAAADSADFGEEEARGGGGGGGAIWSDEDANFV
mmetsp:Transcript_16687/g.32385  ORF Transcript_16687/g.32385 Transcript_16687/m.32385 type:complete len:209 (+) Transcript_16687:2847-3473(+)